LLRCRVVDFPGGYNLFDKNHASNPLFDQSYSVDALFSPTVPTCLVYVIDTQAEEALPDAVDGLTQLLTRLHQHYRGDLQKLHVEVLLHKVDADGYAGAPAVTPERDVCAAAKRALLAELSPAVVAAAGMSFRLTSVYDHSPLEVFARIAQKLLPRVELLQALLDAFLGACGGEKALLLDVTSKLQLAADSNSSSDTALSELCGDVLDAVVDVCSVYSGGDDAEQEDDMSALVRLKGGLCCCARQVNAYLVLLVLARSEVAQQRGLLEYNVACFKQALARLCRVRTYTYGSAQTQPPPPVLPGASAAGQSASVAAFGMGGYMGSLAPRQTPQQYMALAQQLAVAQGTSLSSLSIGSLLNTHSAGAGPGSLLPSPGPSPPLPPSNSTPLDPKR
jgi:Ras-related GTP-binding protein C/D